MNNENFTWDISDLETMTREELETARQETLDAWAESDNLTEWNGRYNAVMQAMKNKNIKPC